MDTQHQMRTENKRKRQQVNNGDKNFSRSFSQLSISQGNSKKARSKSKSIHSISETMNEEENDHQNVENHEQPTVMDHLQKFKPHYLTVSDRKFKEMLSNCTSEGDQLKQGLNTDEKLQFVRQITEAMNNSHYLNLQLQLWKEYYNVNMKKDVWTQKLPILFAKKHRMCRTYGFPQPIVEERLKTLTQEYQKVTLELKQHLIQSLSNIQQWQPYISANTISDAVHQCVIHAQRRLREEFDYKKTMLVCDSNDHDLIKTFYDSKPNQEQVS